MLFGETRGLLPKITSGENHSIWFHNGTTVFFHTYCSIWRKILTGFSTQMESAPSSEAFIILKHLHFMDLKEKRGVKRRQNLFI